MNDFPRGNFIDDLATEHGLIVSLYDTQIDKGCTFLSNRLIGLMIVASSGSLWTRFCRSGVSSDIRAAGGPRLVGPVGNSMGCPSISDEPRFLCGVAPYRKMQLCSWSQQKI